MASGFEEGFRAAAKYPHRALADNGLDYLKNPTAVGQVLRYVAEYEGQWVALLLFSSAALHLKLRHRWLQWSARQVAERRHSIAQNARFLVLAGTGRWPNLASRVLKLVCAQLARDWQQRFGHPVLAVEVFVDSQRFSATGGQNG